MTAKSRESARETISRKTISFRWIYIILPLAILILSVVLTAYFYHLLPGEVAYHFEDGSPDKWMSRGAIIAWMLTPQVFFVLLAAGIVWGITILSSRYRQEVNIAVKRVLSLMGNMVALPQIILSFAMLDIFSYNSYQIRIMPLWVFALIVMVLGGIILGVFFAMTIRQVGGYGVKITRSDSDD
ncbi:DUF1648 domain-containing protein [Chloroflexota bacterium]